METDDLLARIPSLERPLVLLESGAGRPGPIRIAWGAKRRVRVEWDELKSGSVLDRLPNPTGNLYGVIAYDVGLPPRAVRHEPMIAQPAVDLFEPENEVVIEGSGVRGQGSGLHSRHPDATNERRGVGEKPWPLTPDPWPLLSRSFDQPAFEESVRAIRERIAAGDVYQINLSVAERYHVAVSPWEAYLRLRSLNPSPWMGFADFGDWQLVSGSPELLLERTPDSNGGSLVRTRPIAGTRKKTGDPVRDGEMRAELKLDAKEQAEHRMLVDLARNDLGRVAEYGSVNVSEREVVEEYSHVFHLVSEVRARVAGSRNPWEMFAALFPGGTITGTPKIRAMEVIAELEPVARGMYTGALGWMSPQAMQFNILIRSAVMRGNEAVVQAGAGIVWDSDPAREWRESLRKAAAVREAIGVRDPGSGTRENPRS